MKKLIWSTAHALKVENIVDSNNCFIYDTNGKRFIDLESGVWSTSVGHNNKRVNAVITSQINKITHSGFCYCHPILDSVSEKILEITGIEKGKCEFLCSGSEAVEYGMRVARTITDKPLALTFTDSYFGAYGDAAIKDSSKWHIYNWLNCSCSGNKGCVGECDNFKTIPFEKIGIFLFEPGSSSGLVRFPSKELIEKIAQRVKEYKGMIMANEITTGIGRTGKWFGYQHYNIVPDIVAMGKGIGNGYPVSITAISDKVAKRLENTGFIYSQSHQNDPLGAVVASEVIKIITDDNLLAHCTEKGEYLRNEFGKIDPQNTLIKEIRGRGLMIAIEFKHSAMQIFELLLQHGIIVVKRGNTEVLRLDPALTVEKETLDMFIKTTRKIMDELKY